MTLKSAKSSSKASSKFVLVQQVGTVGLSHYHARWLGKRVPTKWRAQNLAESLALAAKTYVSPCQRDTSNEERVNRAWALRIYP